MSQTAADSASFSTLLGIMTVKTVTAMTLFFMQSPSFLGCIWRMRWRREREWMAEGTGDPITDLIQWPPLLFTESLLPPFSAPLRLNNKQLAAAQSVSGSVYVFRPCVHHHPHRPELHSYTSWPKETRITPASSSLYFSHLLLHETIFIPSFMKGSSSGRQAGWLGVQKSR